jgi:hypothetical protein
MRMLTEETLFPFGYSVTVSMIRIYGTQTSSRASPLHLVQDQLQRPRWYISKGFAASPGTRSITATAMVHKQSQCWGCHNGKRLSGRRIVAGYFILLKKFRRFYLEKSFWAGPNAMMPIWRSSFRGAH